MKFKVTATVTCEIELDPDDYDGEANPPKTAGEIIAWELQQAKDTPGDSCILDDLRHHGEFSDIKIEMAATQENAV